MQGVYRAALAAPGQVRANAGADTAQSLGSYVERDPMDGLTCSWLLPLSHNTPRVPIAVCSAVPTAPPLYAVVAVLLHFSVPRMCRLSVRYAC